MKKDSESFLTKQNNKSSIQKLLFTHHSSRITFISFIIIFLLSLISSRAQAPSPLYSSTEIVVLPRDAAAVSTMHSMGYVTLSILPGSNYHLLKIRNGITVEGAISELKNSGLCHSVQPNFKLHSLSTVPNDPSFASQYHHAIMRCTEAWDFTTGSSSETIAIIDTGGDSTHADLSSRVVFANGIDILDGDSDPSEPITGTGHATMVAGMAAAATNNGIDIAGVDWSAKVMFVRVLDENGSGSDFNVANGIRKAVENKATAINLSLGETIAYTIDAIEDALLYARNSGIPVFAASGNNASEAVDSLVAYPANSLYAFAVGATTSSDTRASFSAYRTPSSLSGVDVAAPGDNVLTLSPGATTVSGSGTSFATPLVTAAAALLKSIRPEFSPANIIALMNATAKDIGPSGYDEETGWGRIDLYSLLSNALYSTLFPFSNDTYSIRADTFSTAAPGEIRTASVSANAGRRGRNALLLDADDDYVGYVSAINSESGTIEFYMKYTPDALSETRFILTQKGLGAKSKGNLDLVLLTDSRLQYSLFDSGTITSSTRLNSGEWYHIAITYGPKGMILYVNGESEASKLVAGAPPTSDTIYLGSPSSFGSAHSMRGYIDAIRFSKTQRVIFPSALSVKIVSLASVAKDAAYTKWLAVQNETSVVKLDLYADRDNQGYDGVLLASGVSNTGSDSIDLTPLLSFGDTFYIYAIATDSDFSSETARAYSDTYFTAYSPLASILASESPATNKVCLLERTFPTNFLSTIRELRDWFMPNKLAKILIELYYSV